MDSPPLLSGRATKKKTDFFCGYPYFPLYGSHISIDKYLILKIQEVNFTCMTP